MAREPGRESKPFREFPKAVTPEHGGPPRIAWDRVEEEEIRTGRKAPPPPTFEVEI